MNTERLVFETLMSKKSKLRKHKLSIINDYEAEFEQLLNMMEFFESESASINTEGEKLYNEVADLVFRFNELQDSVEPINQLADKFNDTMLLIEERAAELGAAPFEFMSNYTQAVELLEHTNTFTQFKQVSGQTESLLRNNGGENL